jgi:glucoamylase
MGRTSALTLLGAAAAAGLLVSGASGADPRTPPPLPGHPPPFLGTALIGDGRLLGAVDSYGDLADLRVPGPAGEAQIVNSFAREAAGTVPPSTGIVPRVGTGGRPPQALWRARRLGQRYLAASNVLRTRATVEGAAVTIVDAAKGERLARRVVVRGDPRERLTLRLGVNLDLDGDSAGDVLSTSPNGFVQRDGARTVRCRADPRPALSVGSGDGDASVALSWLARGRLRASLSCGFAAPPRRAAALTDAVAVADRRWLERRRPLGPGARRWARQMYERSLLVLRALTDRRSGAVAAGARDRWAYVWPRDAGTAAIALAHAGYRFEARRIARFLAALDLGAGARFRADSSPVDDGRALPGDSAGWVHAADRAAGLPAPRPVPGTWRDRGDYGERDGDRGDYLANAIAGGAGAAEIKRLFAGLSGLERRAGDSGSGLDSAAAWAVRPFRRPALFAQVRMTIASLSAEAGPYGIAPSQDWPQREAWTAPAGWSAWSLAALGERDEALRLLRALRLASTPAGMLPERVSPVSGVPRSTTPLGWAHSFAVLALRELYGGR